MSAVLLAWVSRPSFGDEIPMIEELPQSEAPVRMVWNDGYLQTRYHLETGPGGVRHANDIEYKALFDVSILFFKDHVELNIMGMTGNELAEEYDTTGLITGTANKDFFIRRLSLSMSPMTGLKVTVGSMAPEHGAGTDSSYLFTDGWVMGYRAKVTLEKNELVVTGGYMGDFTTPDVFSRFQRMGEFNYLQAVFTRSIGDLVRASIDFTQWQSESLVRGAVKVDMSRWVHFIDSISFEDMVSVSPNHPASELAVKLSKRFSNVYDGKDVKVDFAYIYRTHGVDMPPEDEVKFGQSIRLRFEVPNLAETRLGKLGWFVDYVQGVDDFRRFIAQVGLRFVF